MSRIGRRRTRTAQGLLVVAALALGLVPTVWTPAAGADPAPAWTWIGVDQRPVPAGPLGPGDSLVTSPTADARQRTNVTPLGLSPSAFDVSADGSTIAVAGKVLGLDQWSAPYTISATRGMVVVRRDAGTTSSRVVATDWSLGPVVSSDGSRVLWTYRGVPYVYASGGVAKPPAASVFAPRSGETMTAISLSPDGTKAAALYWSTFGARVLAAELVAGRAAPYLERRYPAAEGPLAPDCFAWLDDTQVIVRPTADPTLISFLALGRTGLGGWSTAVDTQGWYWPRLVASQWWVWGKDSHAYAPSWGYRVLATPLVIRAPAVSSGSPQIYSVDGHAPVVSALDPPLLSGAADVRAPGAGRLTLSTSVIPYGSRAFDIAYGQYLAALPGQTLSVSGPRIAGRLETSYDGSSWQTLRWNSLPVLSPWPGTRSATANGYVTVRRSVWVRYVYRGDVLVAPIVSPVRRLTVTPRVSVRLVPSSSGRSRLVSGVVTRVGGRALLYRFVTGRYVVIATTSITSSGRFTFGWQPLPHGAYKVASVADRDWNSGRLLFAI